MDPKPPNPKGPIRKPKLVIRVGDIGGHHKGSTAPHPNPVTRARSGDPRTPLRACVCSGRGDEEQVRPPAWNYTGTAAGRAGCLVASPLNSEPANAADWRAAKRASSSKRCR